MNILALHSHNSSFLNTNNKIHHNEDILTQVEDIIFYTKVFQELKESYLDLKNQNRIILNTSSKSQGTYGYLEFSVDGIKNSHIVINANKTIEDISATIIHELRHYKDLCQLSNKTGYSNILDLELRAFGDTYSFFKEIDMINKSEFQTLPQQMKDILYKSYRYHLSSKDVSPSEKLHMIELMSEIGYSYEKCNYIVSFSTPKRLLNNLIDQRSNKVNSFAFMQKLNKI